MKHLHENCALIGAVYYQNFIEQIRYPFNLLARCTGPLFWLLPVFFVIRSFAPDGHSAGLQSFTGSDKFYEYYYIGFVANQIIIFTLFEMGLLLRRWMSTGILETIWSTPLPGFTYMIGQTLWSMTLVTYDIIAAMLLYYVLGFKLPANFIMVIPWFLAFFVTTFSFGIGYAASVLYFKEAHVLSQFFYFLCINITGCHNPVQALPPIFISVAMAIPLTYFIDFFRASTLGSTSLINIEMIKIIMIVSTVVFPFMGWFLFKKAERACRIRGDFQAY